MYGLSTNSGFVGMALSVGLLVLGFAACGSPPALDEKSFPPIAQTGYAQNAGATGANAGEGGASGSDGNGAMASAAGSGATTSAAGSGTTASGSCPADIPSLFQRDVSKGGCTQSGGCHESSGQKPDLVSANVQARLLNVASGCNMRPYIGKTDSFLEEKLTDSSPACGTQMPFLMPQALNASDKKCIVDWIHSLQTSDTQ
jgi:hypothetical protein